MMTHVSLRYHVLDEEPIPQGEGQFSGVVLVIKKHWQSSLQHRCGVRCKRDHLIGNKCHAAEGIIQYARQAQIVF